MVTKRAFAKCAIRVFQDRSGTRGCSQPLNLFNDGARRDAIASPSYESFDPVVELIENAAEDAAVLAIKITLVSGPVAIRLLSSSHSAARARQASDPRCELRARWMKVQYSRGAEWRRAGAHVVYGVVGLKRMQSDSNR